MQRFTARRRIIAVATAAALAAAGTGLIVTSAQAADTVVPDANFAACLNQRLGQPVTAPITAAQLEGIPFLFCESDGITSVEGAQYLTQATQLDFMENSISDLAPLAGLTNLNSLLISSNQISDLGPLTHLADTLGFLALGFNPITDLAPLANFTKLYYLSLPNDQISDLSPLSNLPNLATLYLQNNQISDVSALTGLAKLGDLNLSGNQVTAMPAPDKLVGLRQLDISSNAGFQVASLTGYTNLYRLTAAGDKITDPSPLAELPNLGVVNLNTNNIANLSSLGSVSGLLWINNFSSTSQAINQALTLDAIVGQATSTPTVTPISGHGPITWTTSLNIWTTTSPSWVELSADGSSFTPNQVGQFVLNWTDATGTFTGRVTVTVTAGEPSAPTVPTLVGPSGSTTDTTPTFSGTADPGASVTVFEGDSTVCVGVADASGAWSCTPGSALTLGAHEVSAKAADPTDASNVSAASRSLDFTIEAPPTTNPPTTQPPATQPPATQPPATQPPSSEPPSSEPPSSEPPSTQEPSSTPTTATSSTPAPIIKAGPNAQTGGSGTYSHSVGGLAVTLVLAAVVWVIVRMRKVGIEREG